MNTRGRLAAWALLAIGAACGPRESVPSTPSPPTVLPSPPPTALPTPPTPPPSVEPITGWLKVEGNRIRLPDGRPFHGRGANIHDTRGCDACAWEPPRIQEVERRIDELTDGWHATFLRLLLESYPDRGQGRVHWRNLLEDDDYFRDVLRIIGHIGKKRGVYVLVSLWQDPSFNELGWPTEKTRAIWKKLAAALADMPFVMFGLVNEPKKNDDGKLDKEVWTAMNETVLAIRSVERPGKAHIVTVQGTREWGRSLAYYVDHPITAGGGVNIAYETHVYNRPKRFDELVGRPAKTLPVVIGEFGAQLDKDITMYPEDCTALMDMAERMDVPWLAWTFHTDCPPNLLVAKKGVCAGAPLDPSPWGRMVKERLARPW